MRVLSLILLILNGCAIKSPQPQDTLFKDQDRNWKAVYEEELRIALENDDEEAFYFFWREYLKEI